MTKLLEEKELAEIRARVNGQAFSPAAALPSDFATAAKDRRALLSHVEAQDNTIAEVGQMYRDQFKDRLRAEKERDSLSQRLAAAERDAARYRWLRDQAHPDSESTGLSCMEQRYNDWGKSYHHHFVGTELDATIDAALSSQEQKCETPVECPECGGDVATGAHQLHCTLD